MQSHPTRTLVRFGNFYSCGAVRSSPLDTIHSRRKRRTSSMILSYAPNSWYRLDSRTRAKVLPSWDIIPLHIHAFTRQQKCSGGALGQLFRTCTLATPETVRLRHPSHYIIAAGVTSWVPGHDLHNYRTLCVQQVRTLGGLSPALLSAVFLGPTIG